MKKKRTYQEEVEKLEKAIDIAIVAYRTHPPKGWTPDIVMMVTTNLENDKDTILDAEPKFRTLASLKYDIEAVFTYFQEATGKTVEFFWNSIKESGLDYERVNRLAKILKRGKIKGRVEYEYVKDMILVAEQAGLTTETETKKLNELIGDFELNLKK